VTAPGWAPGSSRLGQIAREENGSEEITMTRHARLFGFLSIVAVSAWWWAAGCSGGDTNGASQDGGLDSAAASKDGYVPADAPSSDAIDGDAVVEGDDAEAGGPLCASLGGNCQPSSTLPQCMGGGAPMSGTCPPGSQCCPDQGTCDGVSCCASCTCWPDGGSLHSCSVCESTPHDGGCGDLVACGNISCAPGCECVDAAAGGACVCQP
jgi:hypothetical protein